MRIGEGRQHLRSGDPARNMRVRDIVLLEV